MQDDIGHPVYGQPVTTIADLDELDSEEMYEGYRDGKAGQPEPGGNRSRAYWHGWRNGALDGGHREKDEAQAILAAAMHAASVANRVIRLADRVP